jgi:cysteine desulfurase/selenocysteine lyase
LVSYMRNNLAHQEHVQLFPTAGYANPTTVFCFNIEGIDPADIGYILENNYGIIVRSGLHCAPLIHQDIGTFPSGSVRVSPSYFTTDEEAEAFNDALEQILRMED